MEAEQAVVAAVGLPKDVEDVAEEGNGSHQNADAEIGGHARQRDVGYAANPGRQGNDQREQSGQHVAQAGNQPDDPAQPEADAGAGDSKGLIQQNLYAVQGPVAEEPCAAIPAVRRRERGRGLGACRDWIVAGHGRFPSGLDETERLDSMLQSRIDGGSSSVAERLTVAQDVVGSIPTRRPKFTRTARAASPTSRVAVTPKIHENTVVDDAIPGLPGWLTPFEPRRGLTNGHLQTIVGNFLPRPPFRLSSVSEAVEVDPVDGSRVLCHCHWQAEHPQADLDRAGRLTVILVHGQL